MPSKDKEIDHDAVLDKASMKMVEAFRRLRDIYKAAEKAKIPRARAVKVFNSPVFQDELERQEEAVRLERARQEVRDEKLTNEVIDRELLRVILLDVEKHGSLKLEGIRLGAVMTGRIQAGNTRSLEGAAQPSSGGSVYQAIVHMQEAAPILPGESAPAAGPPIPAAVPGAAAASAVAPAAANNVKRETNNISRAPKGVIRLG